MKVKVELIIDVEENYEEDGEIISVPHNELMEMIRDNFRVGLLVCGHIEYITKEAKITKISG